MKIRPLRDLVLIARAPAVAVTAAGIVLPGTARAAPPTGRVVATGRGCRGRRGTRIPLTVAPGDVVLFAAGAGEAVTADGREYVLVRERDVLGVLGGEPTVDDAGAAAQQSHTGTAGGARSALDVRELADAFEIVIDLPGVHPGSLRATVTGTTLTVEAVRRPPADLEPVAYRLRERSWGPLTRTVDLGRAVIGAEARATYEAGVLTVRVPKAESARARTIAIGRAARR